ncbi:MAG: hypothetical protein U9M95_03815 [Candidatus Altiarchaeota archaeon]|nr:hypothetical protein [Candidatus Altiarchaeota archaeon]
MTAKPVRVTLIGEAEEEFEQLNKIVGEEQGKGISNSENQQLLRSIKRVVGLLKENPMSGIQIKKKIIPREFPVSNLWKVNLTGYWRMLYTIKGDKLEIVCFILEICDHKKYDKIFGYKKR